jgi:hypothetical protein
MADALEKRKNDEDQRWVQNMKKKLTVALKTAAQLEHHENRRTMPGESSSTTNFYRYSTPSTP